MTIIKTVPAAVSQLKIVEMVAQGTNINVTLSPHELEIRVKIPASFTHAARASLMEAINAFRDKYYETILASTYRGTAKFDGERWKINVKTSGGVDRLMLSHTPDPINRAKQEVFDKVFAYARTMTRPAAEDGKCRYRSDAGPCLIGHLIPDELYHTDFDNLPNTVRSARLTEVLVKVGYPEQLVDSQFFESIQSIHDGIYVDDRLDLNRNGGPERSVERAKTFNSRLIVGLTRFAETNRLAIPQL